MYRVFIASASLFICSSAVAQNDFYVKQLKAYQLNYVKTHEVVPAADKKYFRFYPIGSRYNVTCSFQKITDTVGFTMTTSAKTQKHYFKYGRLDFTIDGTNHHLFVYQSKDLMLTEKYRNYLFVPFTDATTGYQTYGSGRYLEFYTKDIQNNTLQLDFNKAYNPYCAYSAGYKCPIPPKENFLTVAIEAGEKNFAKAH